MMMTEHYTGRKPMTVRRARAPCRCLCLCNGISGRAVQLLGCWAAGLLGGGFWDVIPSAKFQEPRNAMGE